MDSKVINLKLVGSTKHNRVNTIKDSRVNKRTRIYVATHFRINKGSNRLDSTKIGCQFKKEKQ